MKIQDKRAQSKLYFLFNKIGKVHDTAHMVFRQEFLKKNQKQIYEFSRIESKIRAWQKGTFVAGIKTNNSCKHRSKQIKKKMLQPKKTKYRKHQKQKQSHKQKNLSGSGRGSGAGTYAIQALSSGVLSAKLIESFRRILRLKRSARIWVLVFPQIPVTRKPAEVRMGKGKGSPKFWLARVSAGQRIFEITRISEELARQAAKKLEQRSPLKLRLQRLG